MTLPDVEEKPTEAKQPAEPETSLLQSDDQLEETEKLKSLEQRSPQLQDEDTAETKEDTNEVELEEDNKITWFVSPNLADTKLSELTEIIENLNVEKNKEIEIRTIESPTEEENVNDSVREIIDTDNSNDTDIVKPSEKKSTPNMETQENIKEESSKTEEKDKITWHVSEKLSDTKLAEVTEIIENLNVDKNKEVELKTIESHNDKESISGEMDNKSETTEKTETQSIQIPQKKEEVQKTPENEEDEADTRSIETPDEDKVEDDIKTTHALEKREVTSIEKPKKEEIETPGKSLDMEEEDPKEAIETPDKNEVNDKDETEKVTWLVSPNLASEKLTEVTEIIEHLNTDKDVEIKISENTDRDAETEIIETPDVTESRKTEEIEKTTWNVSSKLSDEKFNEVTEIIKDLHSDNTELCIQSSETVDTNETKTIDSPEKKKVEDDNTKAADTPDKELEDDTRTTDTTQKEVEDDSKTTDIPDKEVEDDTKTTDTPDKKIEDDTKTTYTPETEVEDDTKTTKTPDKKIEDGTRTTDTPDKEVEDDTRTTRTSETEDDSKTTESFEKDNKVNGTPQKKEEVETPETEEEEEKKKSIEISEEILDADRKTPEKKDEFDTKTLEAPEKKEEVHTKKTEELEKMEVETSSETIGMKRADNDTKTVTPQKQVEAEPDAETTKNDMDTPCIESKSENIDIIQIENKIIERKESVSSTVEEMISSPKQLDEAIKQLEETTCVKESEILNQEDDFTDKLSSEDRSELVSQPSNNELSHNALKDEEETKKNTENTEFDSNLNGNSHDDTKANIEDLKLSGSQDLKEHSEKHLEEKSSGENDDKISNEIMPADVSRNPDSELTSKAECKDVELTNFEPIGEIKNDEQNESKSPSKDLVEADVDDEDVDGDDSSSEGAEQLQGQLKINILRASNLENKETFGKSDPFVCIKYNDTVLQSDCVKDTLQPEWNFEASFDLIGDQDIEITVKDSDIGKDNILGSLTVSVQEMISLEDVTWLDLQNCKSGKILVSSEYKEQDSETGEDTEEADDIQSTNDKPEAVVEANLKTEEQEKEKESKGFISSIIGTVGGYFYGSKKQEEEKISGVDPEHIPREFQMKPTIETSTDLSVKQPIDFKDESEIILEESEDQTRVLEELMTEKKVEGKVEAILQNHTPSKEESHENDKTEEKHLQNDIPVKEEQFQNDSANKEEESLQSDAPAQEEQEADNKNILDLNASEAHIQSHEIKAKIVEGSEGIKMIISNLLSLLEELSKSVSSQQSIACMKNELIHYSTESIKIMDDAQTDCLSEEKAVKITENLCTVVGDVRNYIMESKELSEESKSCSISPQEFDKLVSDCQQLLASMSDSPTAVESSPEDFLSAKDVMSTSTSFNEKKRDDDEDLESITEENDDDVQLGVSSGKVNAVEKVSPKTESEGETKSRTVDIEKQLDKLKLYFIQVILVTSYLSNVTGQT